MRANTFSANIVPHASYFAWNISLCFLSMIKTVQEQHMNNEHWSEQPTCPIYLRYE